MTWRSAKLSEVADIERDGIASHAIETGTRYLGLEHIEAGGKILSAETVDAGDLASNKFRFTSRHVLYGKLRPYLAKIAAPDFDGICSTDIVPIMPGPRLDRSFLTHFLRQPSMIQFANSRAIGANLPRLSPKALADFEIPLPPLEEQKRIAAILDQADELRRKRQRALDRLNQLGQAIFIEMFGDKIASVSTKITIGDVSERVTKGESPKWQGHSYVDEGALFVTSENVGWGEILSKEPKFVPMEFHLGKLRRSKLQKGDILINLVGASIGRACIFESDFDEANINQAVAVVTLKDGLLLSAYMLAYLLSPWGQEQILGSRVEGARANISLADVRNFEFYMPPREQLSRFAESVAGVTRSCALARNALVGYARLFTSLQHRAFRGELTASSLREASA